MVTGKLPFAQPPVEHEEPPSCTEVRWNFFHERMKKVYFQMLSTPTARDCLEMRGA